MWYLDEFSWVPLRILLQGSRVAWGKMGHGANQAPSTISIPQVCSLFTFVSLFFFQDFPIHPSAIDSTQLGCHSMRAGILGIPYTLNGACTWGPQQYLMACFRHLALERVKCDHGQYCKSMNFLRRWY